MAQATLLSSTWALGPRATTAPVLAASARVRAVGVVRRAGLVAPRPLPFLSASPRACLPRPQASHDHAPTRLCARAVQAGATPGNSQVPAPEGNAGASAAAAGIHAVYGEQGLCPGPGPHALAQVQRRAAGSPWEQLLENDVVKRGMSLAYKTLLLLLASSSLLLLLLFPPRNVQVARAAASATGSVAAAAPAAAAPQGQAYKGKSRRREAQGPLSSITGIRPATMQYFVDTLMEEKPEMFVVLLFSICVIIVTTGGFFFYRFKEWDKPLPENMWHSWGNFLNASFHLQQGTVATRVIGTSLFFCGIFFYSTLIGTITTSFKSRLEWLKEGTHAPVVERDHIVIGGYNHHLPSLLRQLDKNHYQAVKRGLEKQRRQTIVVLTEQPVKHTERMVAGVVKDCPNLRIRLRSGSLKYTASFDKAGAGLARAVILLSADVERMKADAGTMTSAVSLIPLVTDTPTKVIVEVKDPSLCEMTQAVSAVDFNNIEDVSAKLFVQCTKQPGLVDVYLNLLDPSRTCLRLREFSSLAGLPFGEVRKGFQEVLVCGLVRNGVHDFHIKDSDILQPNDKLILIGNEEDCRTPPQKLLALAGKPQAQRKEAAVKQEKGRQSNAQWAKQAKEFSQRSPERILLLGWRPGAEDILKEFDEYVAAGSELVVLAPALVDKVGRDISQVVNDKLQHLRVFHLKGSPCVRETIVEALLHKHSKLLKKKDSKAHFTICSISDEAKESCDELTMLALFKAGFLAQKHGIRADSLNMEFADAKLAKEVCKLFPVKNIPTSQIMGMLAARISEDSALTPVWADIFDAAEGAEIYSKDVRQYQLLQESLPFSELQERAHERREVAIGYKQEGKVVLNPCPRDCPLKFSEGDRLIVIADN